ncbi:MAG: HAMP domain-containing sensor histidine kinase [Acidimicrobiales bacterium]|jgi:two-component system sensor histidine kinase BaeS|nr:HAMP domain-containing sensor histidine kinase [Acidimicrobiales bacterium]|tara:strand:- start:7465 stop:8844 length:1380 start_codon:yes stop_codon:yes gene_type:complete
MRRRLLTALVGAVVAALLAVGVVTVALVRLAAYDTTVEHLENSATTLATVIGGSIAADVHVPLLARGRMQRLSRSLGVENIGVLLLMPHPSMPPRILAELPEGLTPADLDPDVLVATGTSSGRVGDNAWAAATSAADVGRSPIVIVVVSSGLFAPLGPSGRWFLVAAAVTVVGAAVVAVRLSKSLALPLVEATEATLRIAGGELETRLPEPPPGNLDEPAELARAVNAMAESLERSRGLERQFLLSVSHDLRTPMTSIQGYAEALSDGTIDDARRAGGVILDEARRLDRLIHDLLDLARLDSRRFNLDLHPTDVGAATERSVDGFVPAASGSGVELNVSSPADPVIARIDTDRWGQVVGNLIENALRHASGRVDIEVTGTPGHVHLSVTDDGPGIAAEDLPHLFERLYVSKRNPASQESGSGLGLAIVRELVQAMNGQVSAESAPGGGARLTVTVPALP